MQRNNDGLPSRLLPEPIQMPIGRPEPANTGPTTEALGEARRALEAKHEAERQREEQAGALERERAQRLNDAATLKDVADWKAGQQGMTIIGRAVTTAGKVALPALVIGFFLDMFGAASPEPGPGKTPKARRGGRK